MRIIFVALLAVVSVSLMGTTASSAPYFSWENSLDGWFSDFGATPFGTSVPMSVADGAPAAAITDGDYALAIGRPEGAGWQQVVRVDHATSGDVPRFLAAMRENTTIDLDLFIPVGSYGLGWAGFEFLIQGQQMTGGLTLKKQVNVNGAITDPVGEAFHLTWEYNPEVGSQYNADTNWAQISIAIQGGGSMDPVYIDNFQFSGAPGALGDFDGDLDVDGADFLEWQRDTTVGSLTDWQTNYGNPAASATLGAVPEPSTLVLLAAASCAGLLGRRRIR